MEKLEFGNIVKFKGKLGKVVTGDKGIFLFHPLKFGSYYYSDLEEITSETVEETTYDEKISFIEQDFSWGTVVKTHCISNYQIIECVDKDRPHLSNFHIYEDFRDSCRSYNSLDYALIGAICQKYEGCNERLSGYIMRILSMGEN